MCLLSEPTSLAVTPRASFLELTLEWVALIALSGPSRPTVATPPIPALLARPDRRELSVCFHRAAVGAGTPLSSLGHPIGIAKTRMGPLPRARRATDLAATGVARRRCTTDGREGLQRLGLAAVVARAHDVQYSIRTAASVSTAYES